MRCLGVRPRRPWLMLLVLLWTVGMFLLYLALGDQRKHGSSIHTSHHRERTATLSPVTSSELPEPGPSDILSSGATSRSTAAPGGRRAATEESATGAGPSGPPGYRDVAAALRRLRQRLNLTSRGAASSTGETFSGQPVPEDAVDHVLVVSSWRSGSSFLGALVASHPLALYTYEPLKGLSPSLGPEQKRRLVRQLFHCQIGEWARHDDAFHVRWLLAREGINREFTETCRRRWRACQDAAFAEAACHMYAVRVIKVVRMRVSDVEPLLRELPRLRLVVLTRDPRGVVHSRDSVDWCVTECASPAALCGWLVEGVRDAARLSREYPGRVITVSYEHLSSDVSTQAEALLSFLGLRVERRTRQFIAHNTLSRKRADTFAMGLRRDSAQVATAWRRTMQWSRVQQVQEQCHTENGTLGAFQLLGYRIFSDESELRNLSIPLEV